MLGSIIGDIVGSVYEFHNIKTKDFVLFSGNVNFTDDSILTLATADWLLTGGRVAEFYLSYGLDYPCAGYGGGFKHWLSEGLENGEPSPAYNSCGNGSAMRVGAVGWAFETEQEIMLNAKKSAVCTHNHQEGILGAQAIALCIFYSRQGKSKDEIKEAIETKCSYNLDYTVEELQKEYGWQSKWGNGGLCQCSVPQAIRCFLEGNDFEDCIRNAISIGGDSDTIGCMTGSIAEAYYGVPQDLRDKAMTYLTPELKKLVETFEEKYGKKIESRK